VIEQGLGTLAIIQDNWKYIEPAKGEKLYQLVNIESGIDSLPQLYDLRNDIGEKINLAQKNPEKLKLLKDLLDKEKLK